MSDHHYIVEHEQGVRVDYVGAESDARAYSQALARLWLARATLRDPTSGRAIASLTVTPWCWESWPPCGSRHPARPGGDQHHHCPGRHRPVAVAVKSATNKIDVANQASIHTIVINGATNTITITLILAIPKVPLPQVRDRNLRGCKTTDE